MIEIDDQNGVRAELKKNGDYLVFEMEDYWESRGYPYVIDLLVTKEDAHLMIDYLGRFVNGDLEEGE